MQADRQIPETLPIVLGELYFFYLTGLAALSGPEHRGRPDPRIVDILDTRLSRVEMLTLSRPHLV